MISTNRVLVLALIFGLAFHGASMFFTLEQTYDALIHLFFADHYAQNWYEHWEPRWYTGFTVQSYPPLVHQLIALLSYLGGLKFGLYTVALLAIILFITSIYRFTLLLTGHEKVAGYASLLAVFSSTFIETLHLFGQIPTIFGISLLLHSLPDIYKWLITGRFRHLFAALSLIAVTITSHHVTPIFGMVFFIFPLIGMAIMDSSKEKTGHYKQITFKLFLKSFRQLFWRIVSFGLSSLVLIVLCILPYWINTKNNPITQVPIPHGSRDNFLEITSSGLVFFLIPWGVMLLLLPYFFYRFFSKRYLFFGLSFSMLALLGTGGTTPIPLTILGENAFNILTLDRFTFWATIMALPLFGEFVYRFLDGDLKEYLKQRFGLLSYKFVGGFLFTALIFMVVFSMSIGYFRPAQPQKIKMLPIINFLNQDQHYQWRYLTLGFGDQMAWLSAQTKATTVDGNYHSARRLPELTSRAIERLENSKFKGVEGLGSLQQFLTVPEKYHLKFIFSNDKFYDPLLYFSGWHQLQQLENGIVVWEKSNVPPLPSVLSKEEVSITLKIMWGTIPMLTLIIALLVFIFPLLFKNHKAQQEIAAFNWTNEKWNKPPGRLLILNQFWIGFLLISFCAATYSFYLNNKAQRTPENVLRAYYDALDFKVFERAHSYIDPQEHISLAQYMLEVSVTDGLLSSYAKLDGVEIKLLDESDHMAKAEITTHWITPLDKIVKQEKRELREYGGKWYLKHIKLDNDLPPDQLLNANTPNFYNHGRRRITTENTHHEDVLQQPVLEVLSAKLVKLNNEYAIIGELQNVDNIPADVVISATLYDKNNDQLAQYSAKYVVKHKLLPKEVTPFKINFEGIAWLNSAQKSPKSFNPEEFTPVKFEENPTTFNLQCIANITNKDLYKGLAVQEFYIHNGHLKGELFNSGIQEVTVPQLLVSYYDASGELLWVGQQFLPKGVRVQRKLKFSSQLPNLNSLVVINADMHHVLINGLPNSEVSKSRFPRRRFYKEGLRSFSGKGYSFIKLTPNAYVGNHK